VKLTAIPPEEIIVDHLLDRVLHDMAIATGEPSEIHRCFGVSRADQHAAVARDEREHVTRRMNVILAGLLPRRAGRNRNGVRAVGGRDSGGHAFANVGFIGWIGALTGQSEAQMAISEIGVSFPDLTFGNESRIGVPFHFLLRDILQFDQTLNDSISRIENAHRTCDLILGVGDGKPEAETMRGFQYSASVANVISDKHFLPVNSTWHAPIEDVVYFGMDWLCPGYNEALGNQLRSLWGKINMENTVSDVTAIVQTGNLHIAVYDLTAEEMAVSFCKRSWDNSSAPFYAYDRQFVKLDLSVLFSETP